MITDAFAYETITVADTAIGFTLATFQPTNSLAASRAVCTVETAPIRMLWDGTDPTASVGELIEPLDIFKVVGINNLKKLRMIRTGATSATITVVYERG